MLLSPIRSVVRHGRTGGGGFRKQTNAKLSLHSDAGLTAPQPLAMQARNQEPVTLIRRHQGRHFKRFGKTRRLTGLSGMRVPPNILGVSQDGGTDSGRSTGLACERARARFCSGARMAEPWKVTQVRSVSSAVRRSITLATLKGCSPMR